jgi:isopenicillin-N epimerase
MITPVYSDYVKYWSLDESVTFLNHGSFGACPVPVLEKQIQYRKQLESEPLRFFMRECDALIDISRNKLASFVNCNPNDLVFVTNATAGSEYGLQVTRFQARFRNFIY